MTVPPTKPFPMRPMSEDEVLAVLSWVYHLSEPWKPFEALPFDTPIRTWLGIRWYLRVPGALNAYLVDTLDLLNEVFGTEIGVKAFMKVVRPLEQKSVKELCQLLASEAVVADIRPRTAERAMEFLAFKFAGQGAGEALSPATRLEPILRKFPSFFHRELLRLVPGQLPALNREFPPRVDKVLRVLGTGILGGLPIALVAFGAAATFHWGQPWLAVFVTLFMVWLLVLGSSLGISAYYHNHKDTRLQFGTLQTMDDLCRLLCSREDREPPSA